MPKPPANASLLPKRHTLKQRTQQLKRGHIKCQRDFNLKQKFLQMVGVQIVCIYIYIIFYIHSLLLCKITGLKPFF